MPSQEHFPSITFRAARQVNRTGKSVLASSACHGPLGFMARRRHLVAGGVHRRSASAMDANHLDNDTEWAQERATVNVRAVLTVSY